MAQLPVSCEALIAFTMKASQLTAAVACCALASTSHLTLPLAAKQQLCLLKWWSRLQGNTRLQLS